MDGLSTAASMIAVVSVAAQVGSLAKILSSKNAFDGDTVRILQKFVNLGRRVEDWNSRLRLERTNANDDYKLGNRLPPESIPKVDLTLHEMQREYKVALEIIQGKIHHSRQSLKFSRRERDILSMSMNQLEVMNEELLVIAPSLPPYPHNTEILEDRSITIESISRGHETVAIPMKLSELFNESLAGLTLLSHVSTYHALLINLPQRFGQWGNCLFEGPASIDVILDGSETKLRDVITRGLVYIAVIEKHLLTPSQIQDDSIQQRILDQRSKITALLGRGPLTAIALECWTDIFSDMVVPMSQHPIVAPQQTTHSSRSPETKVLSDAGEEAKLPTSAENFFATDLEDLERQTQELQIEVNNAVNITQDSDVRGLQDIQEFLDPTKDLLWKLSRIIDLLFDLTPSIRGLRRQYFSLQEKLAAEQATIGREIAISNTGESSRQPTSADHIGQQPTESQEPSFQSEKSQEERDMRSLLDRPIDLKGLEEEGRLRTRPTESVRKSSLASRTIGKVFSNKSNKSNKSEFPASAPLGPLPGFEIGPSPRSNPRTQLPPSDNSEKISGTDHKPKGERSDFHVGQGVQGVGDKALRDVKTPSPVQSTDTTDLWDARGSSEMTAFEPDERGGGRESTL